MTTEEFAFRQAILADPFCDTVRLAFSDWLEENTDRGWHAELIRAQVAGMACLHIPKPSYRELLGIGHGWNWDYDTDAGCHQPTLTTPYAIISRGFVGEARLPLAAFLEQAGELFRAHPITTVVLTDKQTKWIHLWDASDVDEGPDEENIPTVLFNRMWVRHPSFRTGSESRPRLMSFPDGWLQRCLSWACVEHGRADAGLPELVFPELSAGKVTAGAVG